jgi:isopentenyl diphosphate isomerase/L-lactate dehydrogenase-like FMN-dependent dehydrogenase
MQELRKKARERVKAKCKVCPVCNGVACAGDVPGMGGIGTGVSFQNNIKALSSLRLVMRVLHEANDPDCSTEFFGRTLSLPVLAGPVGNVAGNLGSDLTDKDFYDALLRGCRDAGTMASIGDTPDINHFKNATRQLGDQGRFVIPFIKPWAEEAVVQRMVAAKEAGCDVCGTDVDSSGLTILRRAAAPVRVWSVKELTAVIKKAHELGMKFIVKGIMAPDEAVIAADAGADSVIVSNHGGRVLDHVPGAAEVLPSIADAVGNRLLVMMDGGIRTGADVLKALALGAKVVLICRPLVIIAHGDEQVGISKYLAQIRDELTQAMRLTGCADVGAITRRVLC